MRKEQEMANDSNPLVGQRTFGPEYGSEAIRRLRAGLSISYLENGMLVRETANGHRFEIRIEADGSATVLREL